MAQLPTFIEISVKIPLETTVTATPSNNACISLTADINKANRFCRKVGKIYAKYGYNIKIERSHLLPPTHGSTARVETRNQTNADAAPNSGADNNV